jgi:hypothetical protein
MRTPFPTHLITQTLSDPGGNELEILYEDIPFDFAPLLDYTRLVLISLHAL